MASTVNVRVNVNDGSRAGIRSVRRSLRRLTDDMRRAGGTATIRVNVSGQSAARARRTVRRLQRQLGAGAIVIPVRTTAPNRHTFRRMMLRALTSPMRQVGSFLGGLLNDGIGQGIIGAFKAAGPIGVGILATIILGLVSVIGGALSALLVTALGLAFVGIAGVSAATSKQVGEQWAAMSKRMKKLFAEVGEPLIPVLQRTLTRLDKMANEIAPKFKKAMEDAAPATELFINKIIDGLGSFGQAAFKPIMDAWKVFAPMFGEEWDRFMHNLGMAFADMADLVKEHPTEIAAALGIVFDVLTLLIKTVTLFGRIWASGMQAGLDAAAFLMEAWAAFATSAVNNMGDILHAAAETFGFIPGLGGQLKKADRNFNEWREGVVEDMNAVKVKADEMRGTLDRANRKRKLEADVTNWQSQMGKAKASLKSTMSANARKQVTANISDLQAKVRQAKVELAMLRDKVVNVTVRNLYDSSLNRHAKGGVVGQAASGGVRSNMTLVGEQGPEIVDIAPGSHVKSNPDTRRALRNGAGGAGPMLVQLVLDGKVLAEQLVDPQRRVVKRLGGVQATFGTL